MYLGTNTSNYRQNIQAYIGKYRIEECREHYQMKMHKIISVVPAALIMMSLVLINASSAEAQPVQIDSKFQPDPLTLKGSSGGTNRSNCGNISATPNHTLQVKESLPYLRLTVESQGKPTLLIDGPGGRFCVMADSGSGKPEISGYWQAGNYSLYIGEMSQAQYSYSLSISQQKK